MREQRQEPTLITYYSRLWYSHERGYETPEGPNSLIRRVINHTRNWCRGLTCYHGGYWAMELPSQWRLSDEHQQWELLSISEEQVDNIIRRWQGHQEEGKELPTRTYYASLNYFPPYNSPDNPMEIVRHSERPGECWDEGCNASIQLGWHHTPTLIDFQSKGEGELIEISEEQARQVIQRWKQESLKYDIERTYYAKLWYIPQPEQEEQEGWTPLLRRRRSPSLLQDEAMRADGSWMATKALRTWEAGDSAYEYISISEEQAHIIAQNWAYQRNAQKPPAISEPAPPPGAGPVSLEQARVIGDKWVNGTAAPERRRRTGIYEFDLGYIVYEFRPARTNSSARPPQNVGDGRRVIDRETGEVSVWPSLPFNSIVQMYRQKKADEREQ